MSWAYLDELNLSELVVMASYENMNVHRGLPREVLVSIIKGMIISLPERNIDIWRKTIFAFTDSHWAQCSPLLSCPMKARTLHACFSCLDVQVAECTLVNHQTLINTRDLHRKKENAT